MSFESSHRNETERDLLFVEVSSSALCEQKRDEQVDVERWIEKKNF